MMSPRAGGLDFDMFATRLSTGHLAAFCFILHGCLPSSLKCFLLCISNQSMCGESTAARQHQAPPEASIVFW